MVKFLSPKNLESQLSLEKTNKSKEQKLVNKETSLVAATTRNGQFLP